MRKAATQGREPAVGAPHRFLAAQLEQVAEAIIATDRDLAITSWNAAAAEIYGWSTEEAIGKSIDILLETRFLHETQASAQAHLLENGSWKGDVAQRCKSGQELIVEASVSWLRDRKGRIIGGITVNRDVTGRIRVLEALRRSEAILGALAESAGILLASNADTDIDAALGHICRAVRVELRYIVENHEAGDGDLLGSVVHEYLGDGATPARGDPRYQGVSYSRAGLNRIRKTFEAGLSFAATLDDLGEEEQPVFRGLTIASFLAFPVYVGGKWAGFIGFGDSKKERRWNSSDLEALRTTANLYAALLQRQRQFKALQASETRYRRLFEQSNDAIFLFDQDARIIELNQKACSLLQSTRERQLKRSIFDLHPPFARDEGMRKARELETGGIVRFETCMERDDGKVIEVEVSGARLQEEPWLSQGVVRDLTEQRLLQQGLLESSEREQRALAAELHDSLCQDLKSLEIQAALLEDELRRKEVSEAEQAKEIGAKVNRAVLTAYGLAKGLMPIPTGPNWFSTAIRGFLGEIPRFRDLAVNLDVCRATEAQCENIAFHLYRIAQQAIHNAVQHGKASRVCIDLKSEPDSVVFRIKNNGAQIDEASLPERRLGILIMKARADAMGGTFSVRNAERGGVEVLCRFPAPTLPRD